MALDRLFQALGTDPRLFEAIADQIPSGLALYNAQGAQLTANAAFREMLGPKAADLFGQPELGRMSERVNARELFVPGNNGAIRRVQATSFPLHGPDGATVGIAVVLADKGGSPDLLHKEVMAVVGHDLRNPLAAIRMTAQLLAKPDNIPTEKRVTLAKRIIASSARMDAIVRSLVDYARAQTGALLQLERETVNFQALVQHVVQEQEVVFPGRIVHQVVHGNAFGSGDPARLEQVVTNVISNAFRHGDGSPITVTVDGTADSALTIRVHNRGPTIAPDLLPRLFDPFEIGNRCEGTPRRSVGLGLFVAKQMVSAHEGSISASSNDSQGTTFEINLPRAAT